MSRGEIIVEVAGADAATQDAIDAATSPAVASVLAERIEQVDKHGRSAEHDATHQVLDLLCATSAYSTCAAFQLAEAGEGEPEFEGAKEWPFTDGYKPRDVRTNLVKATAMLLAAIDRLDATAQDAPLVDGEPR